MSATPATTTAKRTDYLSWPDYFMTTAFLAAQRSKDPHTQVGACVVNDHNRIVGIGYNGLPHGCSDDVFEWHSDATATDPLADKHLYVCHAEVNAVLNKNCATVAGCHLYVALFPCNECAKICIQSGIRRIVYLSDKHAHKVSTRAARRMFAAAGVRCERFEPTRTRIAIEFADRSAPTGTHEDAAAATTTAALSALSVSPTAAGTGTGKRTDYISWSEYFMAVGLLAAQRSKDPNTQVGACIVNDRQQIVAIGYNGFPHGCSDDVFPWTRPAAAAAEASVVAAMDSKYLYVCHAEVNAILNKNAADVRDCTIYVTLFPCNECAKVIIQAGIRRCVYLADKYALAVGTLAARRMFEAAGVRLERFESARAGVVVDFADIERRSYSQLPATPK